MTAINGKGLLVIISAPSGGGKDVLIDPLVQKLDDAVVYVTATSRKPRPGEIDGVRYYFYSPEKFRQEIEAGNFFEWSIVHGEFKGVRRDILGDTLRSHKDRDRQTRSARHEEDQGAAAGGADHVHHAAVDRSTAAPPRAPRHRDAGAARRASAERGDRDGGGAGVRLCRRERGREARPDRGRDREDHQEREQEAKALRLVTRTAQVAVFASLRGPARTFTYRIPDGLDLVPGHLVRVGVGPRAAAGVVVALDVPFDGTLRDIVQPRGVASGTHPCGQANRSFPSLHVVAVLGTNDGVGREPAEDRADAVSEGERDGHVAVEVGRVPVHLREGEYLT